MNYDEVVDLIVNEVYNKINCSKNSISPLSKIAVVMSEENISEITKILGSDYNISAYENEDMDGDVIIIPDLSLKAMANLATLNTEGAAEEFVVRMLMKGKEVYVLENGLEYRRYKNTAPKALYSKYLDFEQQIKLNGIQIIGYVGEIKKNDKSLLSNIEVFNNSSSEELEIRNKKVINEAEIRNRIIPGVYTIVIDKRSIITPLAADFIRTHNLRVKRF
ncbi:MAG: hypothetical protein RR128_00180 [Clostridium sp.]